MGVVGLQIMLIDSGAAKCIMIVEQRGQASVDEVKNVSRTRQWFPVQCHELASLTSPLFLTSRSGLPLSGFIPAATTIVVLRRGAACRHFDGKPGGSRFRIRQSTGLRGRAAWRHPLSNEHSSPEARTARRRSRRPYKNPARNASRSEGAPIIRRMSFADLRE